MNEDLRETADRMTAKAAELRERDLHHLNHDGTCTILKIDRNVFAPLLAEVTTDLDEHLGVYRAAKRSVIGWRPTASMVFTRPVIPAAVSTATCIRAVNAGTA